MRTRELSVADREDPLEPEDLERLAIAAYLVGRDDDSVALWERAHHAWLRAGDVRAGRPMCVLAGLRPPEPGRGRPRGGWLARARRLLDEAGATAWSRGISSCPPAFERAVAGDWPNAYAIAGQAAEIGERFGDPDLVTLARNVQGRALIRQGRTAEGMALLDEVMVAVTADEVSPSRRRRRLLQRDRGLPGDLRPAPGAGVDGGADPLVRRAAGPGAVPRSVPGAPRRDHAAARRVAGRCAKRRSGRASGSCRRASRRSVAPSTSRPSCTGCAASSRRPRRRTARPASGDASRSRGWRCCGWPRGRSMPPRRRSVASWTRRRTGWPGRGCSPAHVEIMLAAGDVAAARAGRRRADRRSPPTSTRRCCARWPPTPRGAVLLPRAMPAPPSPRCAVRGRPGRSSRRRTRPRASAS